MESDKATANRPSKMASPKAEGAKRKKLVQIGITLGVMVCALVVIGAVYISYNLGAKSESEKSKSGERTTASSSTDSSSTSSTSASNKAPDDASTYQSQGLVGEGQIPDHSRGSDNPKATVIIYADFECSHCQELASNMDSVISKYSDKVRFISRHFLIGFANSEPTAKLSEAIYKVGGEEAYWKASDKLFRDTSWGSTLTTTELENKIKSYGSDLGLDGQAVLDTYNDSTNNGIQAKLDRDQNFGSSSNVQGTPSVFINGEELSSVTADRIASQLDDVLK